MTLIGSGININMGQMATGALGAGGGEAFTYDYVLSPWAGANLDTFPDWTAIADPGAIRSVGGGSFYPQGQSDDGCASWTGAPIHGDSYGRCECVDGWVSAGDWIGLALRIQAGVFSCYTLHLGDQGRHLSRWDNGVETILDSDLTIPTPGDIYEISIIGDILSTLVNAAELFADFVDATYDEGHFGIVGRGLDLDVEIDFVRFGPMPKGNAFTGVNALTIPRTDQLPWYSDSCLTTTPSNVADGSGTTAGVHAVVPHDVGGTDMHWIELDYGEPFRTLGFRLYDHLTYHEAAHIDDCSMFGRADPGDDWTPLVVNADASLPLTAGVLDTVLWTGGEATYRYYRFEIYSTIDVANQIRVHELTLVGTVVT